MSIRRTSTFPASRWTKTTKNFTLGTKHLSEPPAESICRSWKLGVTGHIDFNEPISSLGSRTRVKSLTRETFEDNCGVFGAHEEMPRCAITMGIATILEARKIGLVQPEPERRACGFLLPAASKTKFWHAMREPNLIVGLSPQCSATCSWRLLRTTARLCPTRTILSCSTAHGQRTTRIGGFG
jgi:hypothetical protein